MSQLFSFQRKFPILCVAGTVHGIRVKGDVLILGVLYASSVEVQWVGLPQPITNLRRIHPCALSDILDVCAL